MKFIDIVQDIILQNKYKVTNKPFPGQKICKKLGNK